MKFLPFTFVSAMVLTTAMTPHRAAAQFAPANLAAPPAPASIQAPAGHTPYLKTRGIGTQNYLCFSGPEGFFWKFLGPQATLAVNLPWMQGEATWQVSTHYLSMNPSEGGMQRVTWQSSFDTSTVWGKAAASSTDPAYVAQGAVPWLLVQVVGAQRGPTGGTALTNTSYIQRVNTSGGVAPQTACDAGTLGQIAMVPYTTDYYFYQPIKK